MGDDATMVSVTMSPKMLVTMIGVGRSSVCRRTQGESTWAREHEDTSCGETKSNAGYSKCKGVSMSAVRRGRTCRPALSPLVVLEATTQVARRHVHVRLAGC